MRSREGVGCDEFVAVGWFVGWKLMDAQAHPGSGDDISHGGVKRVREDPWHSPSDSMRRIQHAEALISLQISAREGCCHVRETSVAWQPRIATLSRCRTSTSRI
ncbi:uncharacterized protein [Physcomitrium patens]|uniref:uncharacterized protein n=1 Tax=Physcomitrium patens TaxID=3218 RepID=UPI003CCD92AC